MSRLRFTISMSLDGFVAGPRQSLKDPLGIGGSSSTSGLSAWRPGARRTGSRAARRTRARE